MKSSCRFPILQHRILVRETIGAERYVFGGGGCEGRRALDSAAGQFLSLFAVRRSSVAGGSFNLSTWFPPCWRVRLRFCRRAGRALSNVAHFRCRGGAIRRRCPMGLLFLRPAILSLMSAKVWHMENAPLPAHAHNWNLCALFLEGCT